MTKEELQHHQIKQTDIKQCIQVLTPLSGINQGLSEEVKNAANEKLLELIAQLDPEPKVSPIRPLSSLGRA